MSTALGVTVLTLALVTMPTWASAADEPTTGVPTYTEATTDVPTYTEATTDVPTYTEPAAGPAFDSDNPVLAVESSEPPVPADSDCLILLRHTTLSDAEREIDPGTSVSWIVTDAERPTPEKCRAIGAR
ncbi:MAG TPA: hypothetical protein VK548_20800 [Candidatus Acidoferrum sp.]|nr:hypothetical protein [Candidatus Acidoferrum sp.]